MDNKDIELLDVDDIEVTADENVNKELEVVEPSINNEESNDVKQETEIVEITEQVGETISENSVEAKDDYHSQVVAEPINTVDEEKIEVAAAPVQSSVDNSNNKKSKSGSLLVILLLLLLLAAGAGYWFLIKNKNSDNYNDNGDQTISTESKSYKSEYKMSGNGLEKFDLYFLKLENSSKNKVYSPLSIKYALEMLSEAASGDTKSQIDAIIGEYKAKSYINSQHMSFANAMFVRNTFKEQISDSYVSNLKTKYNAEVIYDEFANAINMNNWVSDKTFKLIGDLFSDESVSNQNFILTNALAIDMNWNNLIQCTQSSAGGAAGSPSCIQYYVNYKHEKYDAWVSELYESYLPSMNFDGNEKTKSLQIGSSINNYDIVKTLGEENIRNTVTEEYQAWLDRGECGGASSNPDAKTFVDQYIKEIDENYKKVDVSTDYMMYIDDDIKVFAKDLKEYDGTTLQYVGIMPRKELLADYIESIDVDTINTAIKSLKTIESKNFKNGVVTKIYGNIPVFKYDYSLDLINDLQKLGVKDVFDINRADLSKMLSDGVKQYISDASHKATIEFSNEGIKAAAATQAGGAGAAGCFFEYLYDVPVEEIDLSFDKPYMYIIRDKATGEVWFMGTVYEPLKNE